MLHTRLTVNGPQHCHVRPCRGAFIQSTAAMQAFLSLAFVTEALLLAFHLKGSDLEVRAHLLLVLSATLCAIALLCELAAPTNALLSLFRAYTVLLQGTWWCQVGRVLFLGTAAWDGGYMGSAMFLPVIFTLHAVTVAAGLLLLYCVIAYSLSQQSAAQRGFELVERANDGHMSMVTVRDIRDKAGADTLYMSRSTR
jgi:Family of unknown function (DUF716)